MTPKVSILAPENELPAEGADLEPIAAAGEIAASDLLDAYGGLLGSSTLSFAVSADGEIDLGESPAAEALVQLDLGVGASSEPTFAIGADGSSASLDLAAAAGRVADVFDAEDGLRKMVAGLAGELRAFLPEGSGTPVPLVRWHPGPVGESPDGSSGGVAQVLGVWLADENQVEALRSGGGEGILFEEAEVEGRGLRESLVALTVLGVMLGGAVDADAGIFFNRGKKAKSDQEQAVRYSRQAPPQIDRKALSDTGAADTMVVVDVSKQRAYLLSKGRVVLDTPVSTAREGKHTPRGEFQITQRVRTGKTSTIYGCDLPYWMRLDQSAIGLHVGDLPGYPASAGCIRLPSNIAPILYDFTKSGTTVKVVDSWQPGVMVAAR